MLGFGEQNKLNSPRIFRTDMSGVLVQILVQPPVLPRADVEKYKPKMVIPCVDNRGRECSE